jgi:hypothetical protein
VRNELSGNDLVCLDSPFKSKADYNVLFRGDRNRELSGQYLVVASVLSHRCGRDATSHPIICTDAPLGALSASRYANGDRTMERTTRLRCIAQEYPQATTRLEAAGIHCLLVGQEGSNQRIGVCSRLLDAASISAVGDVELCGN